MKDDDQNSPLPLNYSEVINDMMMQECSVTSVSDKPLLGFLTVLTDVGHYDFLINETLANEMIQHLREFLRGESPVLPNQETD